MTCLNTAGRAAAWWMALSLMMAPCVLGSEPTQPPAESKSVKVSKAPGKKVAKNPLKQAGKKAAKAKHNAAKAKKKQRRPAEPDSAHGRRTLALPLKHTAVERIAGHVQRLFGGSPRVRISADQPTNILLVRADAEILKQVEKLVSVLEEASADTTQHADRSVRVFRLEYADAARVREMILELVPFSLGGPSPTVEGDPRTNSLLINAGPGDWSAIETIIQAVDTRD